MRSARSFRPSPGLPGKSRVSCSYGKIAVRTMSRVPVSKSRIRPVERSASLERHTQRFLELRRGLEQIECFCKGTVLKRMMNTPFSSIDTNTENSLWASHPINCSITAATPFELGLLPGYASNPLQRFHFIGSRANRRGRRRIWWIVIQPARQVPWRKTGAGQTTQNDGLPHGYALHPASSAGVSWCLYMMKYSR